MRIEDTQTAMLRRLFEIARRVDRLRSERATNAARRAGLGPERNLWGNALLDHAAGRPWAGVDYSALRLAQRIDDLPSPSRIVDAYYRRITQRGA